MKLSKPIIAGIIVVVLVVAAVGGYFLLSSNDDRVRVGYLTGDLHQLSRVVMMDESAFGDESLLEQYGVDAVAANPAGYNAGGDVMSAFAAGAVDIAWLGAPPTILNAINSNANVKIIAAANNEGSSIITTDESITGFAQLGGKTVATPGPSSIQHLLFLSEAERVGLKVAMATTGTPDPNTVYWTTIAPVNQKAALEKGDVVAAVGWEPYGSDSILDGTAQVIEWSSQVWPNHPCCVIVVSKNFADKHPDKVAKILKANIVANQWIGDSLNDTESENYTKLVEMSSKFSNRNADVVKSALEHTEYTYTISDAFKSGLNNFTQEYLDLGVITQDKWKGSGYSSVDAFVNDLVDASFLEEAGKIETVVTAS